MSNINLNVGVGETKTLTFQTKDKYNTEDIVFNIESDQTIAASAGTNINTVGTPSVTATTSGGTTTFTFNYLKGSQGYQGEQGLQGKQGLQGLQGQNFAGSISNYITDPNVVNSIIRSQNSQTAVTIPLVDDNGTSSTSNVVGKQGEGILLTGRIIGSVFTYNCSYILTGTLVNNISTTSTSVKLTVTSFNEIYDGANGLQGLQGLKGADGSRGIQGYRGYQGYQGYQGSNASIQMISSSVGMSYDSSNQSYTIINSSTDSQTYFVAKLSNSTANIIIKSTSENINHTILFVNDTNSAIRFANVVFKTIFDDYPTPHWIPNDKNYFILNAGEAIEIGYLFCSEISACILSFGNIYKREN